MRTRLVAALAAASLVVAACDSDRRAISRDELPDLPDQADHLVVLDADGFDPERLEVLTTDLIEVRVEGDDSRGIQTEDRSIDTGLLLPGESTFVVFDEEASYTINDSADGAHVLEIIAVSPDGSGANS